MRSIAVRYGGRKMIKEPDIKLAGHELIKIAYPANIAEQICEILELPYKRNDWRVWIRCKNIK